MSYWLHPEAQDDLRANSEARPPLLNRKNMQTWSGPEGTNPLFMDGAALKTFDYVVANMPFSDKRWSTGLHPNEGGGSTGSGEQPVTDYGRFAGYGIQS